MTRRNMLLLPIRIVYSFNGLFYGELTVVKAKHLCYLLCSESFMSTETFTKYILNTCLFLIFECTRIEICEQQICRSDCAS